MDHSPGFLKLVNEARSRVKEVTLDQTRTRLANNPKAVFIDVREDHEWQTGHAAQAVHLGKGIFERDLEKIFPDPDTEIIMYCGGGYRSALVADNLQRMGYRNVASVAGGWRAWNEAGLPVTRTVTLDNMRFLMVHASPRAPKA